MRVLVIGGTGFIGPDVVRRLVASGHEVAIFHRGEHETDVADVTHIHGDRARIREQRDDLARFRPEIAIDMRAMTEADARATLDALRGITGRLLAVSSMDVYRAYGRLQGTEPGPLEPLPLTEDSPLRERLYPYREHTPASIGQRPPWLDDYEKILVERAVLGTAGIAGTVVRLGMVHGERDGQRRFYAEWRRMADGRPAILMSERAWAFRSSRTHVTNVAHAIVLAATDPRAVGRVYNVAEEEALSYLEWTRLMAKTLGWPGRLIAAPNEGLPPHLRDEERTRYEQHLVGSTQRIRRELGYAEVVSREEGLRRALDWLALQAPAGPVAPATLDYPAEDAALVTLGDSAVLKG